MEAGITLLDGALPLSRRMESHYSFDFAQQIHLPSNPLQPGPFFFLTPRKCALFGVCCEGVHRQVNYLIDEAHLITKGSNAVCSFLHDFFGRYGLGETTVHLHCDNCSGQNKNNFVLWYLAWRVISGLHEDITLNFMVVGHTKFAPDSCFGLLKKQFRREFVSSLEDLVGVVQRSSKVNLAQLVGDESMRTFVPTYDLHSFLEPYFRQLPGILSLHHFRLVSYSHWHNHRSTYTWKFVHMNIPRLNRLYSSR